MDRRTQWSRVFIVCMLVAMGLGVLMVQARTQAAIEKRQEMIEQGQRRCEASEELMAIDPACAKAMDQIAEQQRAKQEAEGFQKLSALLVILFMLLAFLVIVLGVSNPARVRYSRQL